MNIIKRKHLLYSWECSPGITIKEKLETINSNNKLQSLSFSGSKIQNIILDKLPTITTLKILNLSGTKITDSGLKNLVKFPNLEQLFLNCTRITNKGFKFIFELKKLRILEILGTGVSGDCFKLLNNKLEVLNADYNSFDDSSILFLEKFLNLKELSLCFMNISDCSLKSLLHLKKLDKLHVIGTKITRKSINLFKKQRPSCKVAFM